MESFSLLAAAQPVVSNSDLGGIENTKERKHQTAPQSMQCFSGGRLSVGGGSCLWPSCLRYSGRVTPGHLTSKSVLHGCYRLTNKRGAKKQQIYEIYSSDFLGSEICSQMYFQHLIN